MRVHFAKPKIPKPIRKTSDLNKTRWFFTRTVGVERYPPPKNSPVCAGWSAVPPRQTTDRQWEWTDCWRHFFFSKRSVPLPKMRVDAKTIFLNEQACGNP